jgi:hypothetical protein
MIGPLVASRESYFASKKIDQRGNYDKKNGPHSFADCVV